MNNKIKLSLATILLASSVNAIEINGLKQNVNMAFSNTSGNTKESNLNAKYASEFTTTGYNDAQLKVLFDISALRTTSAGEKTNEEYASNLTAEQIFANDWLYYAQLSLLKNEFKNLDLKSSIGMGIGKKVYAKGQHTLQVKFGIAQNNEKYTNNQKSSSYTSLNQYIEYNNILNDVSNLYVKIKFDENTKDISDDYTVDTTLGINLKAASNISLSFEYQTNYDNTPSIGFKKTNTKTLAKVSYSF